MKEADYDNLRNLILAREALKIVTNMHTYDDEMEHVANHCKDQLTAIVLSYRKRIDIDGTPLID